MKRTNPRSLVHAARATIFALAVPAVAADSFSPPGQCPQSRTTRQAPADVYGMNNPLPVNAETIAAGQRLYRVKSGTVSCVSCHGERGDGKGPLANQFTPPPRNFACAQTLKDVPDGQLFWIVKNGSPGTAMSPTNSLAKFSDENIWQIVAYLRTLPR
jgi:mono/diheme cytochrome c family protein